MTVKSRVYFTAATGLIAFAVLGVRPQAQTQPARIFNTSFDCNEWTQVGGGDPCLPNDGIGRYGDWTTASGKGDQITAPANNPLGTGRGFRHWRGAGANNDAGGLSISFPASPELSLRFYMRYSAGFTWANNGVPFYTKDIYWNNGMTNTSTFGFNSGSLYAWTNRGSVNMLSSDTWTAINNGTAGDGLFHCYEQYIKMDTNGSNGAIKIWRDGNLVMSKTGLDLGGGTLIGFILGSNQNQVVGGDYYTDYDDVAISLTGYIGPIGGSGVPFPTPPAAPRNLTIAP